MEWLFITCHNCWIVCCLVRDDHPPFLAYSLMISINNTSMPFRALLSAILSVVKKVPVKPTKFSPKIELDTIDDEGDRVLYLKMTSMVIKCIQLGQEKKWQTFL